MHPAARQSKNLPDVWPVGSDFDPCEEDTVGISPKKNEDNSHSKEVEI